MTQSVREQFAQLTKQAFKQVINDQINDRLKTALASDPTIEPTQPVDTTPVASGAAANINVENDVSANGIVTTEEELEAFYIIRAILRETVSVKRIVMRDVQSYCGILLDDNNRKPICRLRFNGSQKAIGFFGGQSDVGEEKVIITSLDDIYKHADRLQSTVSRYEAKAASAKTAAQPIV